MLKIDLRPGEAILIGNAVVTLESKSGQMARLSVQADKSVPVSRVQKQSSMATIAEGGITRKT
jgi:sRNA-binding carbon storage regulator CsrA